MAPSLLYALSFAALAAAQSSSTTVSILFPNIDPQNSLVGSIAGSDASATTYVVGCAGPHSTAAAAAPSGLNSSDIGDGGNGCGFTTSQTVTQGPSTYHYALSEADLTAAITIDCTLSGTTQAVCANTVSGAAFSAAAPTLTNGAPGSLGGGGASEGIPPMTTATLRASDLPFLPVVITAGLSNIKAAGASSTGSASGAGKTSASGSATSGGSSTASGTGSAATKPSSGATVQDPALAVGVAGFLALGLAAFAL